MRIASQAPCSARTVAHRDYEHPSSVRWIFSVVDGDEVGRVVDFTGDGFLLIGQDESARLRLVRDPYVSAMHCIVEAVDDECVLRDLKSTNGTRVNGQTVESHSLCTGDEIRVGKTAIRVTAVRGTASDETERCVRCQRVIGRIGSGVMCAACEANSERENENARRIAVRAQCRDCRADVSAVANLDGRAAELRDLVAYLCPACAETRRAASGVSPRAVGDYGLLERIGAGGYGEVWKARQFLTGRLVAIKLMRPSLSSDVRALRWFKREIAIASQLVHPHIALTLESGDERDLAFYVIEYVDRGDLERLVSQKFRGPLEPKLAVHYALQALKALEHAHELGFVHRDLKPSNLLRTRLANGREILKISDFGLAKSFRATASAALTEAGEIRGTPCYMAREQFVDYRAAGPSADVYALAVTLYYLLTASMPFDYPSRCERANLGAIAPPTGELLRSVLEDDRIPILDRNPKLPEALAAVVDVGVMRDASDRFETAAGLRFELERVSDAM